MSAEPVTLPRTLPRTVLVLLGTDCHPFDRLVRWCDEWVSLHPPGEIRCVVQYGSSIPPQRAKGVDYFSAGDMASQIRNADVVVCHGGPATITECRHAGHLPIVVPRDSSLAEHVDDHQMLFAARMNTAGLVRVAPTEEHLFAALDTALQSPEAFTVTPLDEDQRRENTVRAFADVVADVTRSVTPRRRWHATRTETAATGAPILLYLGGFGRSGTTLLDRMLGEVPGVVSSGEVVHLWERGVRSNERCGCGQTFSDCPLWTEVGRKAFGGWDALDVEQMIRLKQAVDRNRYIPAMLASALLPAYRRRMREYADLLGRLYAALHEVTGAAVIVDSSKHASYGYLLRSVPGIRLRLVHTVRDPRGVANSWLKQRLRPEVAAGDSFMPMYSPGRSGLLWTGHNAMVAGLTALVPSLVVRYEDLMDNPARELRRVLDLAGLAPDVPLDHLAAEAVELGQAHTVAGNPMRFRTGRLVLRRDEGWRTGLPRASQARVRLVTWPLRRRYRY